MLALKNTIDTTITIDHERIKTQIKRLTKAEAIAFRKEYTKHGQKYPDDISEAERDARREAGRQFVEQSLAEYVTVAAGEITYDDQPVVTGSDLVRVFAAREDVLGAFYQAIFVENFVGAELKKKLHEQSVFAPGSTPLIERAAGDKPAPTASAAESSNSAEPAAATDASSDETSGETPAAA